MNPEYKFIYLFSDEATRTLPKGWIKYDTNYSCGLEVIKWTIMEFDLMIGLFNL